MPALPVEHLCQTCGQCQGTELYQVSRPTRVVTDDGTWMYLPHGQAPPHQEPPHQAQPHHRRREARQPRKNKKLIRGHPDQPPDDWWTEGEEYGESEARTHDPTVDPGNFDQVPQVQNTSKDRPLPVIHPVDDRRALQRQGQLQCEGYLLELSHRTTAGVRWRGGTPPSPPTWKPTSGDLRAFKRYERKVRIWQVQIKNYMTPGEAGIALYMSLQGDAEVELEHAPIKAISAKDGVDYILNRLRGPYATHDIYIKRQYLHEWDTVSRWPNETMRA